MFENCPPILYTINNRIVEEWNVGMMGFKGYVHV